MSDLIAANNPQHTSWIDVRNDSDFPIQNLPFGICRINGQPVAVTAIGDYVVNLDVLHQAGLLAGLDLPKELFAQPVLNDFMALGKAKTSAVRDRLSELLRADNEELRDQQSLHDRVLVPMHQAEMLLPVRIGDYTDFYSSEQHAFNVGSMFRDPENALMPNWKHLPVGYHGRASSIVVSGTPVVRPKGQIKQPGVENPVFAPTERLDFELEMAFVTGKASEMGASVSTAEADDYIFGFSLFNDWSARDVQKWEYVPLGPFLAKNFASSLSPWVVTMDALEPYRVAGPEQDPEVLPYLEKKGKTHFDVNLEVYLQTQSGVEVKLCQSNYRHLYWSIQQQLAHQTVNGCNINVGDLYASGTISGPTRDAYGSMLELAWNGTRPIELPDGSSRKFVEDGDTIIMKAYAEKNGVRVGFGEVSTKILPAK